MKPGLIETMFWNGKDIEFIAFHLERFYAGINYYNLQFDQSPESLNAMLLQVAKKSNPQQSKKLRLHFFTENNRLKIDIEASTFERSFKPIILGVAENITIDSKQHTGLKTDQRTVYEKTHQQAKERGLDDLLICNEQGNIVETSIMNIFWKNYDDPHFYTPPIEDGCVGGIMRRVLLLQENFSEKSLSVESLKNAESVFVCNALRGILPVAEIQAIKTFSQEDVSASTAQIPS